MRVRFSPWTFLLSWLVPAPPWYGEWSDSISLGSFLEERWSNGKIPVLGTGEKGSIPLRSPHFDDGGDDIIINLLYRPKRKTTTAGRCSSSKMPLPPSRLKINNTKSLDTSRSIEDDARSTLRLSVYTKAIRIT